jgi:hypothetical protein
MLHTGIKNVFLFVWAYSNGRKFWLMSERERERERISGGGRVVRGTTKLWGGG